MKRRQNTPPSECGQNTGRGCGGKLLLFSPSARRSVTKSNTNILARRKFTTTVTQANLTPESRDSAYRLEIADRKLNVIERLNLAKMISTTQVNITRF